MAAEIVPQRAPSLHTPIRELHHAWGRLDALVGGLPSGRIALVESPDYGLLHALTTGYLVQALGSFPEPVAYVDGGNSINPYAVADLARRHGLDPSEALDRVHLARAFTAYQMEALLADRLEEALPRLRPSLLVVAYVADLFLDREVGQDEAEALLERALLHIQQATRRHGVVTLVTHRSTTSPRSRVLGGILRHWADGTYGVEQRGEALRVVCEEGFEDIPMALGHQTTLEDCRGE